MSHYQRFVGDFLIDPKVSQDAIACADQVRAKINEEVRAVERIFEIVRSGDVTVEELLDQFRSIGDDQ
jgi:hypothetical protein